MKSLRLLAFAWAISTFQITNVHAALTLDNVNYISKSCVKLLINNPEITNGNLLNSKQDYFEWSRNRNSIIAYNCLPKFSDNGNVRGNLDSSILGVVNKIAVDLFEEIVRFQPRPKGQFEKTVDYDKAINIDRLQHLKKYSNTKLNLALYAYVWEHLMGGVSIASSPATEMHGFRTTYRGPNLNPIYNADKETLSINVMFDEYRIPASFDIKMTPTQAEKLLKAFGGIGIYAFAPTLTFYLDGYNLVIKKLSLKPDSNSFNKEEYDAIGIDLENIPTNLVIKRAVGAEISKNFEANIKKQK